MPCESSNRAVAGWWAHTQTTVRCGWAALPCSLAAQVVARQPFWHGQAVHLLAVRSQQPLEAIEQHCNMESRACPQAQPAAA